MTKYPYKFGIDEKPFTFDCDPKEMYCVLCKNKYAEYFDPFTVVIDTNSFIEVTYELCLKCIDSFQNCNKCNIELNEPYEIVYFNILDSTYYCCCCYNDKRNNFYKKCYNARCHHCVEKYNIDTQIIKNTVDSISLDHPPKKHK